RQDERSAAAPRRRRRRHRSRALRARSRLTAPVAPSSVAAVTRVALIIINGRVKLLTAIDGLASGAFDTVKRMTATTTISSFSPNVFHFTGIPNTCAGDSGGPALSKVDGVEQIAGVHSGGSQADWMGEAYETRVDV